MNCPHCNINLVMTERSGVEIDYCPQCRGVWLDRGELDKIIERMAALAPAAPPQAAPQYQQPAPQQPPVHQQFGGRSEHRDGHYGDKHGYGQHKKKSILSELFDF